jgi:serine/threonine-protein kinase
MSMPERLGKYHITAVLGEGAMGVVYKGFDADIQRTVALKTIRRHLIDNSESAAAMAARFRNEAQAAGRLHHPGIVGVYDYGDEGDIAYIAMEYVEGASLARYIATDVRFDEDDVVSITVQLLDALEHAHAHGVWHRDIKPANLLLTQDGRLKIADFGIARIASVQLRQVTSIVGTPGYMAPEQFLGRDIDGRVDLYAAGVLLYQLLVGQPPFSGSLESLMYRVVNEPPTLPSAVPGYERSDAYDGVLAKALAKQAAERHADAGAFRQALLAAIGRPVPGRVSGETLITQRETPAAEGSNSRRAPLSASHWDPAVLSQVEASLARHLGPLAAVLVRRTARDCHDLPTLYARLTEQVTNPTARNAFMAQQSTTRPPGTGGTRPAATGPGQAARTISEALVTQSTKLLAMHVGPIAAVVVKRAAAKATSRKAYLSALEEAVIDTTARAHLRAELNKLA